jgi:hypothetical protein
MIPRPRPCALALSYYQRVKAIAGE